MTPPAAAHHDDRAGGQSAAITVEEELNWADTRRLRAHLAALARTHTTPISAPIWPYAGGDGRVDGRGSTRAVVTVSGECDRGGAERLQAHLTCLLGVDVGDLRVDLTALTGADQRVAAALNRARIAMSVRGGTFTVAGGRRLIDDIRHLSPPPTRSRNESADHP